MWEGKKDKETILPGTYYIIRKEWSYQTYPGTNQYMSDRRGLNDIKYAVHIFKLKAQKLIKLIRNAVGSRQGGFEPPPTKDALEI